MENIQVKCITKDRQCFAYGELYDCIEVTDKYMVLIDCNGNEHPISPKMVFMDFVRQV